MTMTIKEINKNIELLQLAISEAKKLGYAPGRLCLLDADQEQKEAHYELMIKDYNHLCLMFEIAKINNLKKIKVFEGFDYSEN
jgi:hypothetical protein